MISMTGYAYKETTVDNYKITLEIKSLNNRFLDIYIDSPSYMNPYENDLRQLISTKVNRGKVKFFWLVKEVESNTSIDLDLNLARQYFESISKIQKEFNLDNNIRLDHLIKFDSIFQSERNKNTEEIWNQSKTLIHDLLESFFNSRHTEGALTKKNILFLLEEIKSGLEEVKKMSQISLDSNKEKVKVKLMDMLNDHYDEQRILMEVAILSSKMDINEEIERLSYHIDSFGKICNKEMIVGKKLDFLTQEMLREMNTISSKANNAQISSIIVTLKNELEKIKEQLRNVE